MSAHRSTEGDPRPAAAICVERGWGIGTVLVGDEGYGPTVIQITSLTPFTARTLAHDGKEGDGLSPRSWVLWCRDWREASAADLAPVLVEVMGRKADLLSLIRQAGQMVAPEQRKELQAASDRLAETRRVLASVDPTRPTREDNPR